MTKSVQNAEQTATTNKKFNAKQSYRYGFAEVQFCSLFSNGEETFAVGDVNVGKREWIYKSMVKSEIIESYEFNEDRTVVFIKGFKNPHWMKDNFGFDVKHFMICIAKKEFGLDDKEITSLRKSKMKDFDDTLLAVVTNK